ncbi:MAG: S8 family peptidase, partial [Bernardetiaceae bacterium]|nr:S8 family peptidase [Bernardetiaceae bacterium]
IHIAVLDYGYQGLGTDAFRHARVLSTHNLWQGNNNVNLPGSDHGNRVLGALAAFRQGDVVGAAYRADFHLFTTESEPEATFDTRDEELWWTVAAERADSLGVDVISTSVGYYDFANPTFTYRHEDLDGRTALITQAADWAAAVGMIVVKAAGNQGNRTWQRLTFPGDADSILTVASVNSQLRHSAFSSRGPSADGRVKPDVAALGEGVFTVSQGGFTVATSGTSFATPLVAGLAAGLWQANRSLTNLQVISAIRQSGSRFRTPNDSIGYGIPNFERANFLITALDDAQLARELVQVYPNPATGPVYVALAPSLAGRPAELKVLDVTGRCVLATRFTADGRILELTPADWDAPPGTYLFQIKVGEWSRVVKVSKQ